MDRNSETYLPDATQKLISYAFGHEHGEEFANDPGFPQMQAVLTRQLLENPEMCASRSSSFIEMITAASQ